MSSFAWKCVFYRPANNVKGGNPMELNFEGLDMHKWNIPTGTAQRVDEKNRITFLVIMFTNGVMVIKISKKTHFLYFCWWQQKISHSLRLNRVFSENGMVNRLWSYRLLYMKGRNIKETAEPTKKYQNPVFLRLPC